uniref:Ubiquitin-like domain-containing protein n=1 Tax=Clastoptera arizonana TaxID=38151 RepID=A0A1B6E7Z8_9HEMI
MKVIIKVLNGQECALDVETNTTILELKQNLQNAIDIPVDQQKLLLAGRPLADEKCLCDYPSIKDGTKLMLVIKKESIIPDGQPVEKSVLRDAAYNFLRDFYSESDTLKIVDEFMKEFSRSMSTLSLDDYDRIACSYFEDEKMS